MKLYNKIYNYFIDLPYQVKAALATLVVGTFTLHAAEENNQPQQIVDGVHKVATFNSKSDLNFATSYTTYDLFNKPVFQHNGALQMPSNTYVLNTNDTLTGKPNTTAKEKASKDEKTITGGDFDVKFVIKGKTVTYYYPGDSIVTLKGNIPNRQNNPGALKYGEFAKDHGAIGKGARGFAIFPSAQHGIEALKDLLRSDSYNKLTVYQAMKKFAPAHENDPKAYANKILKSTGVNPSAKLGELTEAEFILVVDKIAHIEGFGRFNEIPTFVQEVQRARASR